MQLGPGQHEPQLPEVKAASDDLDLVDPDLPAGGDRARLGHALGEVARRRATALGPRRPELLLDLPTVGQSVLHVPGRSAGPLDPEPVARRHPARPTVPENRENPAVRGLRRK